MTTTIELPTNFGEIFFTSYTYDDQEILVASSPTISDTPFLRIHSSCIFSETFKTIDWDCSRQLDAAIKFISEEGGIIIYSYQEGRGLGLTKKIEAIKLEHELGLDTAEAFERLGYEPDPRSYEGVLHILKKLKINKVILDTGNPNKIKALEAGGISIIKNVKLKINSSELIDEYRQGKVNCLGHHE